MWHSIARRCSRIALLTMTETLTVTSVLKNSSIPIALWAVSVFMAFGLKRALENAHMLPHRQGPNQNNNEVDKDKEQSTVTEC